MQSNNVKAFKNMLRNYEWLISVIKQTKSRIDDTEYLMSNVKAIQYDKEPSGYISDAQKTEMILKYGNILEELNKALNGYITQKQTIDSVLNRMNRIERKVAELVYIKQTNTFESLTGEYHYSASALRKRLDKAIEKFFDEKINPPD